MSIHTISFIVWWAVGKFFGNFKYWGGTIVSYSKVAVASVITHRSTSTLTWICCKEIMSMYSMLWVDISKFIDLRPLFCSVTMDVLHYVSHIRVVKVILVWPLVEMYILHYTHCTYELLLDTKIIPCILKYTICVFKLTYSMEHHLRASKLLLYCFCWHATKNFRRQAYWFMLIVCFQHHFVNVIT